MADQQGTQTVGFIGLGNMGRPMARNVARAGHPMVVHDADGERERAFARDHDARVGGAPSDFEGVDVLVTMLPHGDAVREAVLGSGIADALPGGAVLADTSSCDPLQTRRLAADLASRDVAVVDAPVSGGMARASDGTLSVMLGADDERAARRVEAVLAATSSRVFRTGALGSGHAMKALNNAVLAAGFTAAAEALLVGTRFGLEPATVLEVLNQSSGRNVSTETTLVEEVLTRRFRANFALGLFSKDLGIAVDLAGSVGVDVPVADAVHGRLVEGASRLGPSTDYTELIRMWEDAVTDTQSPTERNEQS